MKEKRKGRHDKGGSTNATGVGNTEFIGFDAFANTSNAGGSSVTSPKGPSASSGAKNWSPVFTGTSEALQQSFARIAQKRDGVTKTKALHELAQQIVDETQEKWQIRVHALPHFLWLYCHKLAYETQLTTVRAASLVVWQALWKRVPKAVLASAQAHPEVWGMWYASLADAMQEVRHEAQKLVRDMIPPIWMEQQQAASTHGSTASSSTATSAADDAASVDPNNNNEEDEHPPWAKGVLLYSQRILGYGRPSAMYEALFAKKTPGGGSGQQQQQASDSMREDAEERFNVLTGLVLDALCLLFQDVSLHSTLPAASASATSDAAASTETTTTTTTSLFRCMTSPVEVLRLRTYRLVSIVASHEATRPLLSTSAVNTLLQSLSSEKNPNAWPALLEAFLAVAVAAQKHVVAYELPIKSWRKGLIKALRKALLGASVASWGPILLPLTSTLSSLSISASTASTKEAADEEELEAQHTLALELIQAAWEGQHVTLGMTEAGRLAMAVAETAHYILLRPTNSALGALASDTSKETSLAISKIWLEVLENALTDQSLATGNARKAAWEPLLQSLAQQLQRYQDQSEDAGAGDKQHHNAFAAIRNEFWAQVSWPCTHPDALAFFVSNLTSRPPKHPTSRVAATCFQKLLAPYQESSVDVPSLEVYRAVQALVDYHPKSSAGGVVSERFVMNDLLQWSILHTTSQQRRLSRRISNSDAQQQREEEEEDREDFVQADFHLLASALGSVSEGPEWWSTILKEIIAAKPNLHSLTIGLQVILNNSTTAQEWISCQVLDDFARDVFDPGSLFTAESQLEFCRTVLGLATTVASSTSSQTQQPIVSQSVWERWIQVYKDNSIALSPAPKALPQILLQMTQIPSVSRLLDPSDVESIVLQSWLQERAHDDDNGEHSGLSDELRTLHHYTDVLDADAEMAARVVDKASLELKRQVAENAVDTSDPHVVQDFGLRAWRLVEMCQHVKPARVASLSLLGLDHAGGWQGRPDVLYELAMALFHRVNEKSSRFALLQNSNNSVELFRSILVGICEASNDLTIAARVSHGHDKTSALLEALGAASQQDFLDSQIRSLVPTIVSSLVEGPKGLSQKLTTILSSLLRALFPLIPPPLEPKPVPSEIHAGDRLWYISDPKCPNEMESVTVAKAHYDAEAGYYFTIHIDREGEKAERQTIAERLRKSRDSSATVNNEPAAVEDERRRSMLCDLLVTNLLLPHFDSSPADSGICEVINALVCRIGLGSGKGIGSPRFELFKLLSEQEKGLRSSLELKNAQDAGERLWKLALSFGFGLNTEPREGTFRIFAIDPGPSHDAIASLYDQLLSGEGEQLRLNDSERSFLDKAVLAWLSVTVPSFRASEDDFSALTRTVSLGLTLANRVLAREKESGFTSDAMLALKSFAACRNSLLNTPVVAERHPDLRSKEAECFGIAIESFSSRWWSTNSAIPVWKMYSDFPRLVEAAFASSSGRALLADSIPPSVSENLVFPLFSASSRFAAFNLLDCVLTSGKMLRDQEEIVLADSTSMHLQEWKEGMDAGGGSELEEDVEVVSQWLPLSMMSEIETWQHETFEDLNETKMIGRLLAWLSVLRLIETAAPSDFRSRPAFVTYLTKAQAASSVLNVSILFDETINSSQSIQAPHVLDTDRILESEEMISVENLASHVMFRTFETLPSLCRRWWEEECPKVYISRVQSLVEKQIAPEILKRELRRMKEATKHFGEMSVSGSLMSREVTANYIQDDFTLSALIRLPSAFPLRSAEVDCSRTLGVPMNRWKRWSLQITLMLNNQGGTLQDALMLWKENVDREFEGVEPCPVCYSVLHSKTHKLPSLECSTCHNRFHSDCLTQWFKQSGKSQCVLCQQDWVGFRV